MGGVTVSTHEGNGASCGGGGLTSSQENISANIALTVTTKSPATSQRNVTTNTTLVAISVASHAAFKGNVASCRLVICGLSGTHKHIAAIASVTCTNSHGNVTTSTIHSTACGHLDLSRVSIATHTSAHVNESTHTRHTSMSCGNTNHTAGLGNTITTGQLNVASNTHLRLTTRNKHVASQIIGGTKTVKGFSSCQYNVSTRYTHGAIFVDTLTSMECNLSSR